MVLNTDLLTQTCTIENYTVDEDGYKQFSVVYTNIVCYSVRVSPRVDESAAGIEVPSWRRRIIIEPDKINVNISDLVTITDTTLWLIIWKFIIEDIHPFILSNWVADSITLIVKKP